MSSDNSILDKIIQSKQMQEASLFDPSEIISNLLKPLSNKERDILHRRFGLLGKSHETLEQIGKQYQITRERIRQIESSTIQKIKDSADFATAIEVAQHHARHVLEHHGGLMEESHLLDELLSLSDNSEMHRTSCIFLLNHFLDEHVEPVEAGEHLHAGWRLQSAPLTAAEQLLDALSQIIEEQKELVTLEKLVATIAKEPKLAEVPHPVVQHFTAQAEGVTRESAERILQALLRASRKIDQNILGEWGLTDWSTVSPKRMGDKVYLILKKIGKPLHFTDITNQVNEASFDRKVAYPATVHNELILDSRFVLVGRGIYALSEWGYAPGTVIDIIAEVLAKNPDGLTRDEIVQKVLEQRIVRKSTIYLALSNKEKIRRLPDQRYAIVA